MVFNPSPVVSGAGGRGVKFVQVNSSIVNNCTFNGAYTGIDDVESLGGKEELIKKTHEALKKMAKRPALIRSFFKRCNIT